MPPDENDSQNEPKPEKKNMGIDKGGLGHPDPEMRGRQFCGPGLRVSIWPTNKGGPRTPPLDPPLNNSQASRTASEPLGKRTKI